MVVKFGPFFIDIWRGHLSFCNIFFPYFGVTQIKISEAFRITGAPGAPAKHASLLMRLSGVQISL